MTSPEISPPLNGEYISQETVTDYASITCLDDIHELETLPTINIIDQTESIEEVNDTVTLPYLEKENNVFLGLSPQQRQVYAALKSIGYMSKPNEIGKIAEIDRKSVSARLSELRTKGLVSWKEGGYYDINPLTNPQDDTNFHRRGVISGLFGWRVQNVNLIAFTSVGVSEKVEMSFGDISISSTFGVSRGKVFFKIGCPYGLDYGSWLLVLDKIDSVCGERGYVDLSWRVAMCEFFRDHESRKLDGVSGLTLNDFNAGVISKIYEKPDGVLRQERRVNRSIPVDVVTAFLMGGLPSMNIVKRIEDMERQLKELTMASKVHHREFCDYRRDSQEDSL